MVRYLVYFPVMVKLNIQDAKTHLSEHLERLERGDEDVLVICRRNRPIAEVRAITPRCEGERPIFTPDPRFSVPPAFFEPLPEELTAALEGRGA